MVQAIQEIEDQLKLIKDFQLENNKSTKTEDLDDYEIEELLQNLESNMLGFRMSEEEIEQFRSMRDRIKTKIYRKRKREALVFLKDVKQRRIEHDEKREQQKIEIEEIITKGKEEEIKKKQAHKKKTKKDVQKYFDNLRAKNIDKMEKAIKRAEENAKRITGD